MNPFTLAALNDKATKTANLMLLLMIVSQTLAAQSGNRGGRSGAQFLEIGVSARGVGMGGAYVAVANDASATYYNPAGLVDAQSFSAMFSHIQYPAQIIYDYAAAAIPADLLDGVAGVYIGKLSSGEMLVRTPLRPEGTGEKFEVANYVVGLSYARKLTDWYTFGISFKYVKLDAFRYTTDGLAVDFGGTYRTGFFDFRFSWMISNLGMDLKFINESFSMPTAIEFGIAADPIQNESHSLTLSVQANRPNDNVERASVGMEYRFEDFLALRSGYRINYDSERYSLGGGVSQLISSIGRITLDYAYVDMRFLTQAHRFTLSVQF